MTKWLMIVASLFAFLTLSGCNTVSGMGKDIQKGGQEITKAANDGKSS